MWTPEVITIAEAVITCLLLVLLIIQAFIIDKRATANAKRKYLGLEGTKGAPTKAEAAAALKAAKLGKVGAVQPTPPAPTSPRPPLRLAACVPPLSPPPLPHPGCARLFRTRVPMRSKAASRRSCSRQSLGCTTASRRWARACRRRSRRRAR